MKTILPVGPYHPLQEEAENFRLVIEGETVVDLDVRISFNHRGIEDISTRRTWDQVPFLVERVCGICSASHPMAYVRAVEEIIGLTVPDRARYLRTIVCELERLHSHMLWAGLAGHFIGYNTVFMWAWRYREPVMDCLEEMTGSRINYANCRIGGVRREFDESLIPFIRTAMDEVQGALEMLLGAVTDDPVIHARTKGVGVLRHEDAIAYAVTGPTARASGVPIDVRVDDPYGAYEEVDWEVIVLPEGDVFAKFAVRVLECLESIKIIRQCLDKLPGGPIQTKFDGVPPGEGCGHVEAPRGETFHYVRSDGTNHPVRHKIRAPSYVNVPSFRASGIGQTISDATINLASVDPCYSCTERMVAFKGGEIWCSGPDLARLSQEKTEAIRREMEANQ